MSIPILGIHHVTAAANSPQEDYDFYTRVLALRMVKKTINHETANQYHFFYGDHTGNAGTIMTNILFEGIPLPKSKPGRGSITDVSYSVAPGSIPFWRERLTRHGFQCEDRPDRFGEPVLHFEDPTHVSSELIETSEDNRDPGPLNGVPDEHRVRGFHSISLISRIPELSIVFFRDLLGFEIAQQQNGRTRLAVNGGGAGKWIDLVEAPADTPWAAFGLGAIHHVALTMQSKADMHAMWNRLSGAGFILTDLRDRKWFHSMYMTEPGGINVEFSDTTPGFTVDEPLEELGQGLHLPAQWADQRAEIEARLPALNF